MMRDPRTIDKPNLLVVEGKDAEFLFLGLLQHMALDTDVHVDSFEGTTMKAFIGVLPITPGFGRVARLGLVRDAEQSPEDAFRAVQGALKDAHLPVPTRPEEPEGDPLKTSILILPDAQSPGMLEDLLLQAVANDPVIPCIDRYFSCVRRKSGEVPGHMPKARVRAFLASRPRPELKLGEAACAGYWNWSSPRWDHVKAYLRGIFAA
jgi:hypothetical protein